MTDYLTELFGDANPSMEEIEAGLATMLAVEKTRITNLKAEMATKASAPRCSRCGGTGILTQFMHRQNGMCFACGGSGNA
jgi:DnaJ-class molecular chaperone